MERLLLEIGTEEIPAGYIQPALNALTANLSKVLSDARIDHGAVTSHGTPRRLVAIVEGVALRQRSQTEQVMGPPERIAFDDRGEFTVPAQKFAEKVGLAPKKLKVVDTEKGRYLCASITDKGTTTKNFLKKKLPEIILNIPFPKTMRWSDLSISFARPIQTIAALLGTSVISFTLGGRLKSGRHTWGHMFMNRKRVKIESAESYIDQLSKENVIVDIALRKQMVREEVEAAARKMGGAIVPDEDLLDTVTNLVEIPVASGGRFDDEFLELPREILITSMREHQKYFAVNDSSGNLMPCFVAVNNTRTKDMVLVAKGHERVLRARLSDAQFFYRADLKQRMETWSEQLEGVLFQAKLGTMHAKVVRVEKMAAYLAGASAPELQSSVVRAAHLCKADLVCQVVGEFPKLQGTMGRIYAKAAGENEDVVEAIEEHYRPTFSGGPLPETRTGALLAVADKLDSICGCFSVGLIPTGASDPYALRRQGIGVVQIILAHKLDLSLAEAISEALKPFAADNKDDTQEAVYGFIRQRIDHMLAEDGFSKDVIAAVTSVSVNHIPHSWKRVAALQQLKGAPDFEPLATAFKRVVNIVRKAEEAIPEVPDAALFKESSEGALYEAYLDVKEAVAAGFEAGDMASVLMRIAALRPPVDRFFDDVMVMCDDQALRRNRLALLKTIATLFNRIADFSKIAT